MSGPKETALTLAALTALRDLIDNEVKNLRGEMSSALLDVYEDTGADRITVTLPGSKDKLASVSLMKETATEDGIDVNARLFTEWVQANAPEEIVPTVRASYAKVVHDRLVIDDDDVIDPFTGQVVDYATIRPAAPPAEPSGKFTLRFEGGTNGVGRAAFAEAWRTGQLTELSDTLAIGPGVSA